MHEHAMIQTAPFCVGEKIGEEEVFKPDQVSLDMGDISSDEGCVSRRQLCHFSKVGVLLEHPLCNGGIVGERDGVKMSGTARLPGDSAHVWSGVS